MEQYISKDSLVAEIEKMVSNGKKYQSRFMYRGKRYFMQHPTAESAEKEYKRVKSSIIKAEAEKLYAENLITKRVYNALIKYTLEKLI